MTDRLRFGEVIAGSGPVRVGAERRRIVAGGMGAAVTAETRVPRVNDDRLCWLAVCDRLGSRARRLGPFGLLGILAGGRSRGATRLGGDLRREAASDRMADYAVAVDQVSGRLSAPERARLRATGEVPPWFLDAVEQRAAELRRQR